MRFAYALHMSQQNLDPFPCLCIELFELVIKVIFHYVLCPWRFMLGRILLQVLGRQARHLSLSCSLLESADRAGLLVSFPEGMVSCKPGQALGLEPHIFCWAMWLVQCVFSCMGLKVPPWRRAVPAMDESDVRCVHVSFRQACSICVSGSVAHALEGRNLGVCSSLCPWWFL